MNDNVKLVDGITPVVLSPSSVCYTSEPLIVTPSDHKPEILVEIIAGYLASSTSVLADNFLTIPGIAVTGIETDFKEMAIPLVRELTGTNAPSTDSDVPDYPPIQGSAYPIGSKVKIYSTLNLLDQGTVGQNMSIKHVAQYLGNETLTVGMLSAPHRMNRVETHRENTNEGTSYSLTRLVIDLRGPTKRAIEDLNWYDAQVVPQVSDYLDYATHAHFQLSELLSRHVHTTTETYPKFSVFTSVDEQTEVSSALDDIAAKITADESLRAILFVDSVTILSVVDRSITHKLELTTYYSKTTTPDLYFFEDGYEDERHEVIVKPLTGTVEEHEQHPLLTD